VAGHSFRRWAARHAFPIGVRRLAPGFQFALFMTQDFIAAAELPDVPAQELHARFFWYRKQAP
jgi:hypothetical protein